MTSVTAFSKRHPQLIYMFLAFALSWGGIILLLGGIPGPRTASLEVLPLAVLAMLVGPSVGSLVVTALAEGRAGLRALGARLRRMANARWTVVALLAAPLSLALTLIPLWLISETYRPGLLTTDDRSALLLFAVVGGLATGFCEELGWTGFAVPRLRQRYGLLASGLLLGAIWGAWHFLVNLWGSESASAGLSLALFLPVVLFAFLVPFRVLMVWLYERSGSLPAVMLMHASLVAFWQLAMPTGIVGVPLVTWYLVWGAVLWVMVGVVVLSRREARAGRARAQVA